MSVSLPSIYLTRADFGRLERLVTVDAAAGSAAARQLAAELTRAVILQPEEIAPDVVTMNSAIRYALSPGGQMAERMLVFPEDYIPTGQYVSVMSPLGTALLGLRAGACRPFQDLSGAPLSVIVAEVSFQPQRRRRDAAESASILRFEKKPARPSFDDDGPGPDNAA